MPPEETIEPVPVDQARLAKLMMGALAVLSRESSTPLERQWARQVVDLCAALDAERRQQPPSSQPEA